MVEVADTETAREFMRETLERVDAQELSRVAAELERKAAWFGRALAPEALDGLDDARLDLLISHVFSARRNRKKIRAACDAAEMRRRIDALLHGGGIESVSERFEAFAASLRGVPDNVARDFASEILHFTYPDRYWLWTRWLWDPKTRTGALPLVTSAFFDLAGESPGETYLKVGRAQAFVHENGDGVGFRRISPTIFGTDVFLCCVYAIYAYTVLRMRMTREFNKVMPELAAFCRRILGTHRAFQIDNSGAPGGAGA